MILVCAMQHHRHELCRQQECLQPFCGLQPIGLAFLWGIDPIEPYHDWHAIPQGMERVPVYYFDSGDTHYRPDK
jgi:hypothetical protein